MDKKLEYYHITIFHERTLNFTSRKKRTNGDHSVRTLQKYSLPQVRTCQQAAYQSVNQSINQSIIYNLIRSQEKNLNQNRDKTFNSKSRFITSNYMFCKSECFIVGTSGQYNKSRTAFISYNLILVSFQVLSCCSTINSVCNYQIGINS